MLFAGALAVGVAGPLLTLLVPASTISAPPWVWLIGLGLSLTGLAFVLTSQQAMGNSWRIGVDPTERTGLVTTGAFAAVRNPIFSAMALAIAGVMVMTPNAASAADLIALIAGMELQGRVEEPYLLDVHGPDFVAYAARAGRLMPSVGRMKTVSRQSAPTRAAESGSRQEE
ncbi:methyltransferase family protein [Janibacter alittae]|uniref:Isoprenylcysteine carboxylmethyltransferase family protein n=1 Tax=Janibacter alittae TaxID=3115209 RepID=A0ABZ2MLZ5_9MICO